MIKQSGFTLFEIIIAIAILAILVAVIVPISDFLLIKKQLDVNSSAQELISILTLARSKALASENNKEYGVYLNAAASPNQYILFEGESYALRDIPADQVYFLPDKIELYGIDIIKISDSSNVDEIVFNRLTGVSEESGSFSIRFENDTDKNKTVYISSSGATGFSLPSEPDDTNRVKDSRHIHFDYSRVIDTASENIILDFDNGGTIETISISQNLSSGEFSWQGTVDVSGENQTIYIHTHRLNNPDAPHTQFSVYRDRRYNTLGLKITISGDSSGYLAQYSADGLTTNSSSIYVSNFAWQ